MTRPNILLITSDQQRGDALGVARSAHPVLTPHLDQLAREGVRHTRAYTDCPSCVPARVSIMTGKTAYRHGRLHIGSEPLPMEDAETLPGRLSQAGYQTQAVGKMHFQPPRRRYGFQRMRLLPEDYVNWLETTPYPGGYRGHGLGGNEVYPAFSAVPTRFTGTHWIVDESIDFLRQRDPQAPFFLWTSFEAPHPPFEPPPEHARLYEGVAVPAPARGEWLEGNPPPYLARRRRRYNLDLLRAHTLEQARRHYYAEITHIDYELGRLFGELRNQGLWSETVILFSSDHGEMLGDHGIFHKLAFYQGSACVPFILRAPHSLVEPFPPGSVRHEPVLLADILPTLLALAGMEPPDRGNVGGVNGLDLAGLAAGAGRWICGYTPADGGLAMATDGRWKYLYSVWNGVEQLFDLNVDADECRDLLGEAGGHGSPHEILAEARRVLAAEVSQVRDDASPTGLRAAPAPAGDDEGPRNPFAWRGPLRYGDGW